MKFVIFSAVEDEKTMRKISIITLSPKLTLKTMWRLYFHLTTTVSMIWETKMSRGGRVYMKTKEGQYSY